MQNAADTDKFKFLDHPAKGASIAFATLFAVSGGLHIWQSWKHKSYFFTWPLPCACILIMTGFICREMTAWGNYAESLASAIQGLFYSAAFTFMVPLQLVLLCIMRCQANVVPGPPALHFAVMTGFNTASITTLSQGAATYFNPDARPGAITSGLALIKASLILQLALDGAMLAVLYLLHRRVQWTREQTLFGVAMCAMVGLVFVRTIFRTVQIFLNPLSPIWIDEVYFWVFEACLMLAFTTMCHIMQPWHQLKSLGDENADLSRRDS